jgi:hypothetical protein
MQVGAVGKCGLHRWAAWVMGLVRTSGSMSVLSLRLRTDNLGAHYKSLNQRRCIIMQEEESPEGERRETIEELSNLLFVVQEMGRRLANETHGKSYDLVRELNELLHRARAKLDLIQQTPKNG